MNTCYTWYNGQYSITNPIKKHNGSAFSALIILPKLHLWEAVEFIGIIWCHVWEVLENVLICFITCIKKKSTTDQLEKYWRKYSPPACKHAKHTIGAHFKPNTSTYTRLCTCRTSAGKLRGQQENAAEKKEMQMFAVEKQVRSNKWSIFNYNWPLWLYLTFKHFKNMKSHESVNLLNATNTVHPNLNVICRIFYRLGEGKEKDK